MGKLTLGRLSIIGGLCAALGCAMPIAHAAGVVTIYSADGLKDGQPNWFATMFKDFTAKTGIRVQYVEGGSGVVINRVMAERDNPQADVLVTLPPFIQQAAAAGLLVPYAPPAKAAIAADTRSKRDLWYPLVNNFSCWIYNPKLLKAAPANYHALLATAFKNRLQYSTPGEAGDGTAVMLMSFKLFGGTSQGFDYLKQLQANNLGPSSSTGRLAALVNKGELLVANGDVQMNYAQMTQYPDIKIAFPAGPDGKKTAMALPYDIGLVKGAPHSKAGQELIAFLLSKSAQDRVYDLAGGFPVRRDIPATGKTAAALKALMHGVSIWTPDWSDVLNGLKQNVATWHQITGS